MVDCYGRWTWEPTLPKAKWCDCDQIASRIVESGYKVKTTIENLVTMILLYFFDPDNEDEYGAEFTIESCMQYVEDHGGFREFDYFA